MFHGLLLLVLIFGHTIANPRPDDDDKDTGGAPVSNADSDESAKAKCISPGDFFYSVNLVTETDFLNPLGSKDNGKQNDDNNEAENNNNVEKENTENDQEKNEGSNDAGGTRYERSQHQVNGTDLVWKRLKVNRYYGVLRDRFYVRNIEGCIVKKIKQTFFQKSCENMNNLYFLNELISIQHIFSDSYTIT